MVCNDQLDLAKAQHEIAVNWTLRTRSTFIGAILCRNIEAFGTKIGQE
jgi:hypothetical protein